ncbi:hypothetical protein DFH06DRAFT_1232626, partial [Mycena polygramma]
MFLWLFAVVLQCFCGFASFCDVFEFEVFEGFEEEKKGRNEERRDKTRQDKTKWSARGGPGAEPLPYATEGVRGGCPERGAMPSIDQI